MPDWFGFPGYELCSPPARGFWRVSSWRDPFAAPPPAPPLDADPRDDDGHRYDDPNGHFRTLYCATDPEGAIGECIADFMPNPETVRAVEAYFAGIGPEGGAEDEEDYRCGLDADDVEGFGWQLAHAPPDLDAKIVDVEHWRTHRAVAPAALPLLGRFGVRHQDREALLSHRRPITRTLAGVYRAQSVDESTGDLRAVGLRFFSRLPPKWECWALWEPLPVVSYEVTSAYVTIDLPQLRLAAAMLGVALVE